MENRLHYFQLIIVYGMLILPRLGVFDYFLAARASQLFGVFLLVVHLFQRPKLERHPFWLLFFMLISSLACINIIHWGGVQLRGFSFLFSLGYSWYFVRLVQSGWNKDFWVVSIFAIMIAGYVIFMGTISGVNPNLILANSMNHLATAMIGVWGFVVLFFREAEAKGREELVFVLVSLMCSFVSVTLSGRVGLGVGIGMVVTSIIVLAKRRNNRGLIGVRILIVALGIMSIFVLWNFISSGTSVQEIRVGGLESIRWRINRLVLSHFLNFEYPFGYWSSYFSETFGLTSHNSFIELYKVYGWFGVLLWVPLILVGMVWLLFRDLVLFLISGLVLSRAFFDTTLFDVSNMSLLMSCVLLGMLKRNAG